MRGQGGIHVGLAAVKFGEGGPAGDETAPSPPRARTGLLALGAVSAAVTVASLSITGFSSVNLDHLLDHPLSFHSLLTLPTVLALACLALATLPRTLLINLAVLAGLIAAAETTAWMLAPVSPASRSESGTLYARDAALGYVLTPSVVARHRLAVGNREVYSVTYEVDDRGRRRTPTTPGSARSSIPSFLRRFEHLRGGSGADRNPLLLRGRAGRGPPALQLRCSGIRPAAHARAAQRAPPRGGSARAGGRCRLLPHPCPCRPRDRVEQGEHGMGPAFSLLPAGAG